MNNAMYSGVAGLTTHQTRMDVIGNNIANVNTYGYKAQRAVFSDVFYQTIQGATQGTANQGGTNPSSIGYGVTLSGIQSQMSTSSMQSTGFALDVAITGEGFLQVMDGDGNIFYTKAGLLTYDTNGYLVDINGNFVLGTSEVDGDPASQKIKIDNLGTVPPAAANGELTINNIKYTMSMSENTEYGNTAVTFSSNNKLPAGLPMKATISSTGAILVEVNAYETFADMDAFNAALNDAILEANGGVPHAGGSVKISSDVNAFPAGGLTGAQITGAAGGVDKGSIAGTAVDNLFDGKMDIIGVSSDFKGAGATTLNANLNAAADTWTVTLNIGGVDYTGDITATTGASTMLLKSADGDYVEVTNPGFTALNTLATAAGGATTINGIPAGETLEATASVMSPNLGLSADTFVLEDGTVGGPVDMNQISGIVIGQNGTISVTHSYFGTVAVGKISLATFANQNGLQTEGSNYYSQTLNSGDAVLADPGTDGTGTLKAGALEMSNVDISEQFADMIVTQRGFQANSRIITVSDTMMEEVINMKR